jgi:Tol biopolymer transport system component
MGSRRRLGLALSVACGAAAALAAPGPGNAVLVSANPGGEEAADSYEGSPSNSGRFVAFYTLADNLVIDDGPESGNGEYDVYLKDLRTGAVTLVSHDEDGGAGNDKSYYPTISASGRWIVYMTEATDIGVSGGTGWQVMRHDARTGENVEISLAPGGENGNASSNIYDCRPVSGNGRWVVFASDSSNLVDGDLLGYRDVFLVDAVTGTTRRLTEGLEGEADGDSSLPSISPNGRWVLWTSAASNLVEGDGNGYRDVFLHDLRRGTTRLVSRPAAGGEGDDDSGDTGSAAVSANGRLVAFPSDATNLDPDATETLGHQDIFLADLRAGTVRRISNGFEGAEGNGYVGSASMDPAGRIVTYWTYATNMLEADSGLEYEQIGHDVRSGENFRLLFAAAGGKPDNRSYGYWNSMSANGRWHTLASDATDVLEGGTSGEFLVVLVDLRK